MNNNLFLLQSTIAMLLHKFLHLICKFPSCYYLIDLDFFEVVTDFTILQLSPHFVYNDLAII